MLTRLSNWFHILRAILLLVAALFYCISPIDLVPDTIPLLGWADDLVILATGLASLIAVLRKREPARLPPPPER